jgi:exodeoxyribonuclease V alpha subunit
MSGAQKRVINQVIQESDNLLDLFGEEQVSASEVTENKDEVNSGEQNFSDDDEDGFYQESMFEDESLDVDPEILAELKAGFIQALDMEDESSRENQALTSAVPVVMVRPPVSLGLGATGNLGRFSVGSTAARAEDPTPKPAPIEALQAPPVATLPRPRFGAPLAIPKIQNIVPKASPAQPSEAPMVEPELQTTNSIRQPKAFGLGGPPKLGATAARVMVPAATSPTPKVPVPATNTPIANPVIPSRGRRGGNAMTVVEDEDEQDSNYSEEDSSDPKGMKSAFVLNADEYLVTGRFRNPLKEDAEKGTWFGIFEFEEDGKFKEGKLSVSLALRQSIGRGWFDAAGKWRDSINKGKPDRIFNVRGMAVSLPKTKVGVRNFLVTLMKEEAACRFTGAGLDAWIAKHGETGLYKACSHPEIIEELAIPDQRGTLKAHWLRTTQGIAAKIVLESAGVSEGAIGRVLHIWGKNTMNQMKENPYLLLSVDGVTFENVDSIATQLGLEKQDKMRVAGYVHVLTMEAEKAGSTAIVAMKLISGEGSKGISPDEIPKMFKDPSSVTSPVCLVNYSGQPLIASVKSYQNEKTIADTVCRLLHSEPPGRIKKVTMDQVSSIAEQVLPGKPLHEGQLNAVLNSANSTISFLTGGPGTGKSTVSKVLVAVLEYMGNENIKVVAPVGRAARKAGEMSGIKGQTVHRELGAKRDGQGISFEHNDINRLSENLNLLGDEWSMTDAALGAAVMQALPERSRFVMIGDINQLPPVGAGQTMVDLMAARKQNGEPLIPTSQLTKIFRQDESGGIAIGAAKVNAGIVPDIKRIKNLDEIVDGGVGMAHTTANSIWRHVTRIVDQVKESGLDPMRDVFVLSAMRHGNGGTFELNTILSRQLNPKGAKFINSDKYFDRRMSGATVPRVSDRIMFTENDPNLNVMNGDLGQIINADQKSIFIMMDDDRIVQFPSNKWNSLILGYAGTIHKAQGSQYPVTIMAVSMDQQKMLERRLFYTGWTRAMNKLVIVGEQAAVDFSIQTSKAYERTTMLTEMVEHMALRFKPSPTQVLRMSMSH